MLTHSSNSVLEPVTQAMLAGLPHVSVHFGRFRVTEIALNSDALSQFDQTPILQAAELLSHAKVDVIAWNGTSSSWLGFEEDVRLCERITTTTGIPAATSMLAMNEILQRIGVRRLGLITPYTDDVQARLVANHAALGVACPAERRCGIRDNFAFAEVPPPTLEGMLRAVAVEGVDTMGVVCTTCAPRRWSPRWKPRSGSKRHNPDGARRLLAEAGWPNGFRVTLATSNDRIVNAARMVQAIAQMWSRIGVQTTVELMPHAVFTPRRNRYEIPVFLSSWGNQTGEPLYTLAPQLGTRTRGGLGAANRIRYSNPELDRLLNAASAELDRERLLALLRQATDLALSEAVMLPLLLQVNNWGARRGLSMEPRIDQYTLAMGVRPQ
jgi:maleate isomerase